MIPMRISSIVSGVSNFQLRDDAVSISELNDPTQARLVAQCDIEGRYR